jgi:hypothetical protein
MKAILILTCLSPILIGSASCSKKVRTLCRLDVDSQMCWTDQGEGYTWEQIRQMVEGNNDMWCVDTHDLRRIQRKLSECKEGPKNPSQPNPFGLSHP